MVVYNKTVLDKDEVFTSLVRITRRSQLGKFILSTVILVCGLLILLLGYLRDDASTVTFGYVFFAFSLVYYCLAGIAVLRAPKKVYKQNQEVCDSGMTYEYTFKEQSFQVKVISEGKTTKLPYKYDSVKKVLAHNQFYEIRLPENQVLFVHKSGFESPKMEEFFLKNLQKNKKKIKLKTKKEK